MPSEFTSRWKSLAVALLLSWLCFAGGESFAQQGTEAASDEAATVDESVDPAPPPRNGIATFRIFKLLQDGGLMMYPILICSIVSTVFAFERTISLRRGRIIPGPFVKRFLHQLSEGQLSREQALHLCEENSSGLAQVFAAAVRRWGKPCVEVEQAVLDAGERVTTDLRKNLRVFHAVSTVCPLLGLLGTVFGMIEAFDAIASATGAGRAELLASGIGEALIATAFGLTVAIPAMLFYWYFVSCVDRRTIEIDALAQQVVNHVAGDMPPEGGSLKSQRRVRRESAVEAAR